MKACKVKGRTINTIPQAELIFAEGKHINIDNCHISPWEKCDNCQYRYVRKSTGTGQSLRERFRKKILEFLGILEEKKRWILSNFLAGDHCYPEELVFPDGVGGGIALTNRQTQTIHS